MQLVGVASAVDQLWKLNMVFASFHLNEGNLRYRRYAIKALGVGMGKRVGVNWVVFESSMV